MVEKEAHDGLNDEIHIYSFKHQSHFVLRQRFFGFSSHVHCRVIERTKASERE